MINLNSFKWEKDYIVINEGNVETKKLNLFQRIVRFFGLNYQETHLEVVAVKAQELLFNSHSQNQKSELERVIFRAKELKKISGNFDLGEETLKTGENVKYSLVDVRPTSNDPEKLFMTFDFKVQLKNEDEKIRKAFISIYFSQEKKVTSNIDLKVEYLYECDFPSHDDFMLNENDMLARVTYLFITKILKDTKRVGKIGMSSTGRIGGALLAKKYGWKGHVKEYFLDNNVGCPEHLVLTSEKAETLAGECLLKREVSLDSYFLD